MKILLDESIPQKLRNDFGKEHEVWTVRDKDWLGKKNGELLKLVSDSSFDLFITVDRNMKYQQNLATLSMRIVVLYGLDNRHATLQKLIPRMFQKLESDKTKAIIEVF